MPLNLHTEITIPDQRPGGECFWSGICAYLIIAVFISAGSVVAQSAKYQDSLRDLISRDKKDTVRVQHLLKLAISFEYESFGSALHRATQALNLSQDLRWYKGVGFAYNRLGLICDHHGQYERALGYLNDALNLWFQELARTGPKGSTERRLILSNMASSLNNIGSIYENLTDFSRALDFYLKTLKIDQLLNDRVSVAGDLSNIGTLHFNLKEYEKALRFNTLAMKVVQKDGDEFTASILYGNRGSIYSELGEDSLSLNCYDKALVIAEKLNDNYLIATWIENLGGNYDRKGDSIRAYDHIQKALALNREIDYPEGICRNLFNIGDHYIRRMQYDSAQITLDESLRIGESLKSPELIINAGLKRAKLDEALGHSKEALNLYRKYNALSDSVFSSEMEKEITQLELKFVYEKEKELEAESHERKVALINKESELSDYKKSLLILLSVFILLLATVFIVRLRVRIKRERLSFRLQQQLTRMELEKSRLERENLEREVLMNLEKLRTSASFIQEKTMLLGALQNELVALKSTDSEVGISTEQLFKNVKQNIDTEQYWSEFIENFNRVYKDFLNSLTEKFPAITKNEIRLCILLKCNLGNKEIAGVLHIGPDSVKKAHNRIRKKFELDPEENLRKFIQQLS